MTLHVDSEVGRLVQAIEHRRGVELSRLTPACAGVRAHHLGDPRTESLAQPDGRELLQDREPGPPVDDHEEVS